MNQKFNSIAVNFLSSIFVTKSEEIFSEVTRLELSRFNASLSTLGFILSEDLKVELSLMSFDDFKELESDTISILSKKLGIDKKTVPLFEKFPYEMPNMNEYISTIFYDFFNIVYLGESPELKAPLTDKGCNHNDLLKTLVNFEKSEDCPICTFQSKRNLGNFDFPKLSQITKVTELSVAKETDIMNLFKSLVNSKTSLSSDFRDVVSDVVSVKGSKIKGLLPREFVNKENAALVSSLIKDIKGSYQYLISYNKTATDILRFAVACSNVEDKDLSLASDKVVFKLVKKDRKLIMALLDQVAYPLEDLKRHQSKWLLLSKMIHIGAFRKTYKNAFKAIQTLRNDASSIITFNTKVELLVESIAKKKLVTSNVTDELLFKLSSLLSDRHGEFARRLDFMLKSASPMAQSLIAMKFIEGVDKSSINVLLGLRKFLENRSTLDYRVFAPKGASSTMIKGDAPSGEIEKSVIKAICSSINENVSKRFLERGVFENVFIDPEIKKIIVPFALRSAASGAASMTRGSRMKIEGETDVIRFFTQWHNINKSSDYNDHVDLDLSAVIYNDNFEYETSISYAGFDNSKGESYYSGDETDAPGKEGAFEAIDINIPKMLEIGRYVVMSLNSYSRQNFSLFEASAGYMERTEVGGGQAFEPKTVKSRFALNGEYNNCIPLIIDLKEREVIWVDMKSNPNLILAPNNVLNNKLTLSETLHVFSEYEKHKLTMLELFELHSDRFKSIDTVKVEDKEYDLIVDKDFVINLPEIISNWI